MVNLLPFCLCAILAFCQVHRVVSSDSPLVEDAAKQNGAQLTGNVKQRPLTSTILSQLLSSAASMARPNSVGTGGQGSRPSLASLQSVLDVTGLHRLTDPMVNVARKRWERLRASQVIKRIVGQLARRKFHH
ncbi:hypothetical protein HDE_09414 [Halotydeus destructor]|nr:hypothetical protein HDE_09414 [Halotydeus destructor]